MFVSRCSLVARCNAVLAFTSHRDTDFQGLIVASLLIFRVSLVDLATQSYFQCARGSPIRVGDKYSHAVVSDAAHADPMCTTDPHLPTRPRKQTNR